MADLLAVATAILSLALVCVTIWYAWQTQQMVREMAASRAAAVRPALHLDLGIIDAKFAFLVLENVGVGPATQVSVELEVIGFAGDASKDPLSIPLLRVGERLELLYPTWGDKDLITLEALASIPASIIMTGQCRDLDGNIHRVDEVMDFAHATDRIAAPPRSSTEGRRLQTLERIEHDLSQINLTLGWRRGEG